MDKYVGFLIVAVVVILAIWWLIKVPLEPRITREGYPEGNNPEKADQVSMNATHIPKCPTCGSTAVEKISGANKVGAAFLFGVFSLGHLSKTFKCQNCNYKW